MQYKLCNLQDQLTYCLQIIEVLICTDLKLQVTQHSKKQQCTIVTIKCPQCPWQPMKIVIIPLNNMVDK